MFILPLPASGKYEWVWQSSESQLLRSKIDADTYVVFQSPGLEWCNRDFTGVRTYENPRVDIIGTSSGARIGWESFSPDHDHTEDHVVKILSAVVTRLSKKAPDSPIQQDGLIQTVMALPIVYQSVTGTVVPSSVINFWLPPIRQYFHDDKGIVVGKATTEKRLQSRGWEDRLSFDANQWVGDPDAIRKLLASYDVSLTKSAQDQSWHLPPDPMDHHAGIEHFTIPHHFDVYSKRVGPMSYECPSVTLDYHGTPIEVREGIQFFDVDRQLLITLVNSCDSIPPAFYSR